MPALTDAELLHLEQFIGYGNLDADVWWLGMEEGMGRDDDPERNLRARLQNNEVEDLYYTHKRDGVTKFHEGKRVSQPTWWVMCEVMLGIAGSEVSREAKRTYQAERLGRHNDETLLLELMPIPKPDLSSWGYEELIPQYSSRENYYRSVLPSRISLIRALIERHQPKLVIGYGKGYWDHYQRLFGDMPLRPHPLNDEFKYGRGATSVILMPHPTSWNLNGIVELLARIARNMLID